MTSETEELLLVSGRGLKVERVEELPGGHIYVRGRVRSDNATAVAKVLGDGGLMIRMLGHRILHMPGGDVASGTDYYLVRCPHGIEGAKTGNQVREGRSCFLACRRKLRECSWCGETDGCRFRNKVKTCCGSCDRTAHRLGRFSCGKPRRAAAPRVTVRSEHACPECLPWPTGARRTGERLTSPKVRVVSRVGSVVTLACGHSRALRRRPTTGASRHARCAECRGAL